MCAAEASTRIALRPPSGMPSAGVNEAVADLAGATGRESRMGGKPSVLDQNGNLPRSVYNCSPNEWLTRDRRFARIASYCSGTVTMNPGVCIGLRCSGD
jgi:hypothetical protein